MAGLSLQLHTGVEAAGDVGGERLGAAQGSGRKRQVLQIFHNKRETGRETDRFTNNKTFWRKLTRLAGLGRMICCKNFQIN